MDASSSDNYTIGGVAQGGTDERRFCSDLECKWKNVKARIRFELVVYLVETELYAQKTATGQQCYFKERDRTYPNGFWTSDCVIKNPSLLPRKSFWIGEPVKQDVCVEQRSERQVKVS